jgi:hypothetical protein
VRAKLLCLLAATLAATAGCTSTPEGTVEVRADTATTWTEPDGSFRVDLPAGAVAGDGLLAVAQVEPPGPAPDGLRPLGPPRRIELQNTTLTGSATLTWTTPPPSDGPAATLPVTWDDAAHRWLPAPSGTSTTAVTPHFSDWWQVTWDPDGLRKQLEDQLKLILWPPPVADPTCEGSSDAKSAGVMVTSNDGDSVRWCLGSRSGTPYVKVTNPRGFAVSVDYPSGFTPTSPAPAQPLLDAAVNGLGSLITTSSRGRSVLILGAGQSVDIPVTKGPVAEIVVEASGPAYLASALLYGAQTYAMTMDKVPGGPKVDNGTTAEALKGALKTADCVTAKEKLGVADPRTPEGFLDVWKSAVDLGFSCLATSWEKAYGLDGVVGTFVMGAVSWLVSGVTLVVQGGTAVSDLVQNIGGYRIRITVPAKADLTAFVGQWHVHGSAMTISADGSGRQSWNAGPCDNSDDMCTGVATLSVKPSASGAVATMHDVHVVDSKGTRRTDQRVWPDMPTTGSQFSLTVKAPGVLTSAVLAGPQYIGNPLWCDDSASTQWQSECN